MSLDKKNMSLFTKYTSFIRNLDLGKINDVQSIPAKFLIEKDSQLSTYYIPFDHVNTKAKIVIVGITPGFTQWKNAMYEAQKQLLSGAEEQTASVAAKQTGAFSGAMRNNLISLLDEIGIHTLLGVDSCTLLFSTRADLVQMTSILRHPVFINEGNYNGTPSMVRTPFLRDQINAYFAKEIAQLDNPIFVPLGPKVSEGLEWLAEQGIIKKDRIIQGLPHPSGANAERIAYFLGRKDKGSLSSKTNHEHLDAIKENIIQKIAQLRAHQ